MGAREDFPGAWRLVSMIARSSLGEVRYPYGTEPTGLIMWDAHGWWSVQIAPGGDQIGNPPGSYVAYFGTWEIDEPAGELVLHTKQSLTERLRGTDQRRSFRFEGKRVLLG